LQLVQSKWLPPVLLARELLMRITQYSRQKPKFMLQKNKIRIVKNSISMYIKRRHDSVYAKSKFHNREKTSFHTLPIMNNSQTSVRNDFNPF
jgi:hypothetical protein